MRETSTSALRGVLLTPPAGPALQSLLLTGAPASPSSAGGAEHELPRPRERVRHPEPQTLEFGAEADPLQDHAGSGGSCPGPRAPRRGSAKRQRRGTEAQGWLPPGEGGTGLIVADVLVPESLALAGVHIGEVPVSLQTSHMTDDIHCHECSLLSLCEWECYPFKVGALRMGSASGSAQHS